MLNQGYQAVVRAVDRIKNTAQGVRILSEWLGDGGAPVDRSLAQHRLDTCLHCLHNKPTKPDTIEKAVAEVIVEQEQLRHDMIMILQGESNAGTCEVCGCYLKLKAWVPLSYLGDRKMPDKCWISQERKAI